MSGCIPVGFLTSLMKGKQDHVHSTNLRTHSLPFTNSLSLTTYLLKRTRAHTCTHTRTHTHPHFPVQHFFLFKHPISCWSRDFFSPWHWKPLHEKLRSFFKLMNVLLELVFNGTSFFVGPMTNDSDPGLNLSSPNIFFGGNLMLLFRWRWQEWGQCLSEPIEKG